MAGASPGAKDLNIIKESVEENGEVVWWESSLILRREGGRGVACHHNT